jgi:hypothetical protein
MVPTKHMRSMINNKCMTPVSSQESQLLCMYMLGVSTFPLSTILLLDFGAVPTVWYFWFFLSLFQKHMRSMINNKCMTSKMHQYELMHCTAKIYCVEGAGDCRYLHVFISTFPLSTIILLDFGAVPTMWYFCFSFHYFNSISFISFPLVSQGMLRTLHIN